MAAESFVGVRVAGGLLPAELLSRIASGGLAGQASSDYHLAPGETVREAANRAWAYLTGVWATYRQAADKLPESDRGTTLTRERWLLILLRELGYGRVPTAPAGGLTADGKQLPVSHAWEHVPMHLLGHRIELDRRTQGVAGAATSSPQSMVQELLNRSDAHLWAVLSNGLTLRLLRDSTSLVGSAYIEFDLEAIFDADLFADFLLLFSVCHQSRLEVRDPEKGAASCWLEAWRTESLESGSRALNQLRDGVIQAITTLGTGFLAHSANAHLRVGLAEGSLRIEDVNHGLLRVVYRLLFTFVAEDRGLLLAPDADPTARQRFRDYFSTERLRRTARRRRGTRHADQWRALNLVWDGLGTVDGRPELGLVGIGGLFEPGALDLFRGCDLSNEALLRAVRHLSLVEEPGSKMKRVVDYRNLGAEELGSIYEALLEFVPSWDAGRRVFELLSAAGNDRKSTGSYYTPTSLIDCLLDSALDPMLDRAEREPDPEAALLALTVCDPACGSGHFLVAAARRIAKRVAAIRTGDPEPPPERVREALADVVGRCIYGVDLNPLAAELAKVSLWLETLDPGRPLAFLDAQIKVGNSLIGATPALVGQGVPDEAFAALEGDDKKVVTALKKQNKAERSGQDDLFGDDIALTLDAAVAGELGALIGGGRPASLADIHARQQRLKALEANPALQQQRLVADSWCAAFVWPKQPGGPKPVTDRSLHALERGEALPAATLATVHELAAEYRFFHWHLEFPHLFHQRRLSPVETVDGLGWRGGFDVVLGNPPWERVKLQEQEFFAVRDPQIAAAPNAAARKRLIQALETSNPSLRVAYLGALRRAAGESHLLRVSGRYPLAGRGDINTYAVFAEGSRTLMNERGSMGMILPTGIATDATTQYFFKDLVRRGSLVSLYDFENAKQLFEGVHRSFNFCLLTLTGRDQRVERAEFAFFAHDPSDLLKNDARFGLTPEEIRLLNPNTGCLPPLRSRRDAELLLALRKQGTFIILDSGHNPWGVGVRQGLFHLTLDGRNGIVTDGRASDDQVGLYEGKLIHQFDHRFASYVDSSLTSETSDLDKRDPRYSLRFRYHTSRRELDRRLGSSSRPGWLLVYRDIARNTDARSCIAAIIPRQATSYTLRTITQIGVDARGAGCLMANLNSFALDYGCRQLLSGTHLSDHIAFNLPVLPPSRYSLLAPWNRSSKVSEWIQQRVLRLVYCSHSLTEFARESGFEGDPFVWDPEQRMLIRSELDAAFFHLYELTRRDVEHVLATFTTVKRKDEAAFGSYRTKDLIMEVFDAMQAATASGAAYRSPFDMDVHQGA